MSKLNVEEVLLAAPTEVVAPLEADEVLTELAVAVEDYNREQRERFSKIKG